VIKVWREFLESWFNDQDAIQLILDVWVVIQAWDDAYDGDPADHVQGYEKSNLELPLNKWYNVVCVPVFLNQVHREWEVANHFEKHKIELEKAWMLRARFYTFVADVYSAVYGRENAIQFATAAWLFYGEKLEDFKNEVEENA
jgi:hypothetical protein